MSKNNKNNTGDTVAKELSKTPYGAFYVQNPDDLDKVTDANDLPMCKAISRELPASTQPDRLNAPFKIINSPLGLSGDKELCTCSACTRLTNFLALSHIFTSVDHRQHKFASMFGSEVVTLLSAVTAAEQDTITILAATGMAEFRGAPEHITTNLLLFHQLVAAAVPMLIAAISTFNAARDRFKDFGPSNKQADDAHFAISQTIALLSDTLQLATDQFSRGHGK